MNLQFDVDDQLIEDLLVCAFEGGSNYWVESIEVDPGTQCDFYKRAFETYLKVIPIDENQKYILNKLSLKKGLELMAKQYPKHFMDLVSENFDADTGDIFLQLCLFGDVIYG